MSPTEAVRDRAVWESGTRGASQESLLAPFLFLLCVSELGHEIRMKVEKSADETKPETRARKDKENSGRTWNDRQTRITG